MAVWLMLAYGCATSLKQRVVFEPTISRQPQPRSVPAMVTTEDASSLKAKGYCEIGRICAYYPKYGSNKESAAEATDSLSDLLLIGAARYGGDLVHVYPENANTEICDKPYVEHVCIKTEAYKVFIPASDPLFGTPEYRWMSKCLAYEDVPTCGAFAIKTTGTVWWHGSEGCTDNPPLQRSVGGQACAGDEK